MDIDIVSRIKRLTIIALASDDELVETLVLKGGNAIDLINDQSIDQKTRASYDLDYSIDDGDFNEDELSIKNRIHQTLLQTFHENGYTIFDYKFNKRPKQINPELADFWGGYVVNFKVIESSKYDSSADKLEENRRRALPVWPSNSPTFEIEFSKFEYVEQKQPLYIDGYKIYIYTPEMIVFEKLRALCQQLPQYSEIIPSFSPRPRARDFYDIHLIMESHKIDPTEKDNINLIKEIFHAKKVPLEYIKEIKNSKHTHADNWLSVKETISVDEEVESFEFYFEYVVEHFEKITFP